MIFNNTTYLTKEDSIDLLYNASKKDFYKKYVLVLVLFICGIVVLVDGLINDNTSSAAFGGFFIIIGIAYIISSILGKKNLKKKIMKDSAPLLEKGCKYTYKFKEKSIQVVVEGVKTYKGEYKYTDIRKASEYETRYELILKDDTLLYIDKSGFENERYIQFLIKNIESAKKKIKIKYKK